MPGDACAHREAQLARALRHLEVELTVGTVDEEDGRLVDVDVLAQPRAHVVGGGVLADGGGERLHQLEELVLQLRCLQQLLVMHRIVEWRADAARKRDDRRDVAVAHGARVVPRSSAALLAAAPLAAALLAAALLAAALLAAELEHAEHGRARTEDRHQQDGRVGARSLEIDLRIILRVVTRPRHELVPARGRGVPREASADRPAHLRAGGGERRVPKLRILVVHQVERDGAGVGEGSRAPADAQGHVLQRRAVWRELPNLEHRPLVAFPRGGL